MIKFDLAKKELKGHLDLREFLKLNDNENLYAFSSLKKMTKITYKKRNE